MVSHGSLLQSLPPRSNWPIVGREADIDLLLQRLVAGGGGVIIMGAPGLGKSTVMAAVLTKIAATGQRAIRLPAPLERDSKASFIEQWLGVPVPSSTSVDMVAAQIMAQLPSGASSASGESEVSAEVALTPILALDDIHLLDGFSAAVFRNLVEAGQIRLVATCREDPGLPSALDALWRSGHLEPERSASPQL
ncbi:ATP-binding protein [Arthrobacter psychrolactophilus]